MSISRDSLLRSSLFKIHFLRCRQLSRDIDVILLSLLLPSLTDNKLSHLAGKHTFLYRNTHTYAQTRANIDMPLNPNCLTRELSFPFLTEILFHFKPGIFFTRKLSSLGFQRNFGFRLESQCFFLFSPRTFSSQFLAKICFTLNPTPIFFPFLRANIHSFLVFFFTEIRFHFGFELALRERAIFHDKRMSPDEWSRRLATRSRSSCLRAPAPPFRAAVLTAAEKCVECARRNPSGGSAIAEIA